MYLIYDETSQSMSQGYQENFLQFTFSLLYFLCTCTQLYPDGTKQPYIQTTLQYRTVLIFKTNIMFLVLDST